MFAGIDIGGTNIKYGIINHDGEIVFRDSIPTEPQKGPEHMIQSLHAIIDRLTNTHPDIQSVGIGFPSVVNPKDGCIYHPPNLPGWGIVPLRQILQSKNSVPIAIDNDANVAALAESTLGAGKDCSHFLYVTLGTGIGGGIIINHALYAGEKGGAGEIGHIIIKSDEIPGDELPYRTGTLEHHLGRYGLIRMALEIARDYPDSMLHSFVPLDVEDISLSAEKGDEAAILCMKKAGTLLGLGLASILAILDMHVIVIGGGISQSCSTFFDAILETIQRRALPTIANFVEIRKAHFTSHAGLIGASMLGKSIIK
jgi:glucokinase